jgi:hypothetical protein
VSTKQELDCIENLSLLTNIYLRFSIDSSYAKLHLQTLQLWFYKQKSAGVSSHRCLALSNLIQHIDLNMVRALNLTSFTEFDISKNNINELYAQDFKNYPKLKWLDCSNNLIQNIIGNTFQAQSLLEVLNLSENLISFVDLNAFNGLLNLKYLNLSKLHRNYTKRKKDVL